MGGRGLYQRRELFADFGLWQIGGHDDRRLVSLRHLVQVNEDARIALVEMNALMEEHGRIAVGVEGDDAAVNLLGFTEKLRLCHKPLEDGQAGSEPFGMPLHAENGFELRAFHTLYHPVWCLGYDAETLAAVRSEISALETERETVGAAIEQLLSLRAGMSGDSSQREEAIRSLEAQEESIRQELELKKQQLEAYAKRVAELKL